MFCRNCGKPLDDRAVVCTGCGVPPRIERKFCPQCGVATEAAQVMCVKCGAALAFAPEAKSRIAAGILGILLGVFGVHRFYLGFVGIGLTQVLLSTVGGLLTCGVSTFAVQIWGLVEGILILCGSMNRDARGMPLKD